MCNGKSVCVGGLINGGNMMLFLCMIDGGDTTLLSSGCRWTDQRQRHDAYSLGWSTVGLLMCDGESVWAGGLIYSGNTMLFLGMIDGGNTMLLPLAG
jgi:hypothetical protein